MTPTNNQTPKKELTLQDFHETFKALSMAQNRHDRGMVFYASQSVHDELSHAFDVANTKEQIIFLKEKNALSEEECESLEEMINSKDRENFHIAQSIVAIKSKPFLKN